MTKQAIEIFDLVDLIQDLDISSKISKQERIEIWVNLSNLCDDIKILFRYVHFDEYINIRNSILKQLTKLLYNNHVNGYENICEYNKYEIFIVIFVELLRHYLIVF